MKVKLPPRCFAAGLMLNVNELRLLSSRCSTLNYNWGVWFCLHQTTKSLMHSLLLFCSSASSRRAVTDWLLMAVLPCRTDCCPATDLPSQPIDLWPRSAGGVCLVLYIKFLISNDGACEDEHIGNRLMLFFTSVPAHYSVSESYTTPQSMWLWAVLSSV